MDLKEILSSREVQSKSKYIIYNTGFINALYIENIYYNEETLTIKLVNDTFNYEFSEEINKGIINDILNFLLSEENLFDLRLYNGET